ncbi:MAG: DUF2788 domain-containing protein [Alteromonadaceae bacterium]|nr:DUF2788 domain-containing protein [Alteromonadaceae bacterium]
MFAKYYEQIESIMLDLALVCLFVLMIFAVHDVLKKNDVPLIGKVVAYGVLGLGAMGFIAKGIIQLIWQSNGVSG